MTTRATLIHFRKHKMNVWVALLLYKIAPLCPTLARNLRLVCRRLAKELPSKTRAYLERLEIYTSPLIWPQLFGSKTLYNKDSLGAVFSSDVFVPPFFQLVCPHILHENRMFCTLDIQFNNDPLITCTWNLMIPIEEGPLPLFNKSSSNECHLGCKHNTCFTGPPLSWAWTITIDTTRRLLYITKQSLPQNYKKPLLKDNAYNHHPRKKCKLCTE